MASRSPPPSKQGQREDDDDESCHWKKLEMGKELAAKDADEESLFDDTKFVAELLEKGKELAAKDADEEPLFDDTKFILELLRCTFRKLEGVGEAFDIKAHHDVYKDPSVKGLTFRIHGLAEKLENLPMVK
jgi:hypothetical protein